ncbi:hypothetical protein CI109_107089 [Kwoniella shandongensis]|uniref:Uncharacterized protein n=1 Tax=Kwoniella shandongensis TaxID=1734106 RepID=A0A5M6C2T0_9TREE|nr:uncharacterized protein CI109_002372 [Kwoniella shandongensis]KAA5529031.1 hypothetical protein CI109_002372 [Kwoniella shandongensis]
MVGTITLLPLAVLALGTAANAHAIQRRAAAFDASAYSTYLGCYVDGWPHYVNEYYDRNDNQTFSSCVAQCAANNFKYAGVEYGSDCYCANTLTPQSNGAGNKAAASECNYSCGGDSSRTCGGLWRVQVYQYNPTSVNNAYASYSAASSSSAAASASVYSATSLAASRSASASAYSASSLSASGAAYTASVVSASNAAASSKAAASSSAAAASASSAAAASSSAAAAASASSASVAAASSSSAAAAASSKAAAAASSSAAAASASSAAASSSSAAAASSSAAAAAASASSASASAAAASASSASVAAASASASSASAAQASASAAAVASSSKAAAASASSVAAASASSAAAASSSAAAASASSAAAASSSAASVAAASASAAAAASASSAAAASSSAASVAAASASNAAVASASSASAAKASASLASVAAAQSASVAAAASASSAAAASASSVAAAIASSSLAAVASASSASAAAASSSLAAIASASSASAAAASASAAFAASATAVSSGWAPASVACVAEGTSGRALVDSATYGNMTWKACTDFCNQGGYTIAGVEYGRECFCGSVLSNGASLLKPSTDCSMSCDGNDAATCGGSNTLRLFVSNAALSALSADLTSKVVNLPTGWSTADTACVQEGTSGRALALASTTSDSMTVPTCLNYCSGLGFAYAGVEYGRECYCGNSLVNGASLSLPSTTCNMKCTGDTATTCGGANGLQLYYNPSLAVTNTVVNNFASEGCIIEVAGRALTGASTAASDMTIESCTTFCAAGGFKYAGVEYSTECFCGNSLVNGAAVDLVSTQCNMPCGGNSKAICGGPNAITLYKSN